MNCPMCKSQNIVRNAYRSRDGKVVHDCLNCNNMFKTVDKVNDKKQVKK